VLKVLTFPKFSQKRGFHFLTPNLARLDKNCPTNIRQPKFMRWNSPPLPPEICSVGQKQQISAPLSVLSQFAERKLQLNAKIHYYVDQSSTKLNFGPEYVLKLNFWTKTFTEQNL